MRLYIKPTGSGRYDKSGITWPITSQLNWEKWVKDNGGTNLRWEPIYDNKNCPDVLTFDYYADSYQWYDFNLSAFLPDGAKWSFRIAVVLNK